MTNEPTLHDRYAPPRAPVGDAFPEPQEYGPPPPPNSTAVKWLAGLFIAFAIVVLVLVIFPDAKYIT